MYTVEDAYGLASNLYWIAFLLTARTELSFNVVMEVLDSENGLELIPSPQTLLHLRRRVVTKALEAIREQVSDSAQQTALRLSDRDDCVISSSPICSDLSHAQLEKVLFTIDVFPRCALLLTVFEGLHLDDVAELLHTDRELIRRGREAGLWELTRSVGSTASPIPPQLERIRAGAATLTECSN